MLNRHSITYDCAHMVAIPCAVVLRWLSKTKLLPWLWQVRSGSFQVFCKKSAISRNFKTNGIFSNWNHYFLYIFLILFIKLGKKTPFICSFHISTRPVQRGGGAMVEGVSPGPDFSERPGWWDNHSDLHFQRAVILGGLCGIPPCP